MTPIWVPLVSVVIGGLISTGVAFFLQHKARAEAQKASALTLLTKLHRIVENLSKFPEYMEKRQFGAFAHLPSRVHFEADELSVLLRLDADLFLELATFDDEHNGILDVLETHRQQVAILNHTLAIELKGRTLQTLTSDEQRQVGPTVTNIKFLAQAAADSSRTSMKSGAEGMQKLQELLKKKFDILPFFIPKLPAT